MLNQIVEMSLNNNPNLVGMDDVVEKEILHHDIMSVLHHQGLLQRLTFIGGTALRLCYDSSRLSEDLDFTAGLDFKPENFSGLGSEIQVFLERKYGLNVNVYEPKLTANNTSSWKITIEKHNNRPDLPSQKMHIDVCALPSFDIEQRPLIDYYGIKSQIAGLPIPVQSMKEILADKMIAFAYRERRIKPRDVWDIVWLVQQQTKQNASLVTKKLEVRNKEHNQFIQLLLKHVNLVINDEVTKQDFQQEMSRFLPVSVSERTVNQENFWGYVGTTISEQVGQLKSLLNRTTDSFEFKI